MAFPAKATFFTQSAIMAESRANAGFSTI